MSFPKKVADQIHCRKTKSKIEFCSRKEISSNIDQWIVVEKMEFLQRKQESLTKSYSRISVQSWAPRTVLSVLSFCK